MALCLERGVGFKAKDARACILKMAHVIEVVKCDEVRAKYSVQNVSANWKLLFNTSMLHDFKPITQLAAPLSTERMVGV